MNTNFTLNTDGKGFWTPDAKPVRLIKIYLNYISANKEHGELHAEFDNSWKISQSGLIYTDPLFLKELRAVLGQKSIGYSEQGMQGDTFVSLDVGKEFLESVIGKELIQEFYGHSRDIVVNQVLKDKKTIVLEKYQLPGNQETYCKFKAKVGTKYAIGVTAAEAIGYLIIGNHLEFVQDFDIKWNEESVSPALKVEESVSPALKVEESVIINQINKLIDKKTEIEKEIQELRDYLI